MYSKTPHAYNNSGLNVPRTGHELALFKTKQVIWIWISGHFLKGRNYKFSLQLNLKNFPFGFDLKWSKNCIQKL